MIDEMYQSVCIKYDVLPADRWFEFYICRKCNIHHYIPPHILTAEREKKMICEKCNPTSHRGKRYKIEL